MTQRSYRVYLLVVLLLIYAFNGVDRLALGLLLQEIKLDLHLSDTQLGLLTGIAFALFYSMMGIPLARWADRGNRVTIIALTTGVWSAAVAMCGLAGNFVQLLLIRIGVAVGEAGCAPPAYSLIADHFARAERPRAISRYVMGAPLALVIGYLLAGWLNDLYGWRVSFMLLALPGIALAALAWFTLEDPRRSAPVIAEGSNSPPPADQGEAPMDSSRPSMKEVLATLSSNATFRHLLFFFAVSSFFTMGILQWKPAFFIRSFGLQTSELGAWLAGVYGISGLLGTYWGGELASRYARDNERLQLRAAAIAFCGFGVISAGIYLSVNHHMAFALMGLATLGGAATNGPLFATIQTLVPSRMRAMSIALINLSVSLIGTGLGPLAAGALSDAFRSWAGEESLRYSLLVLCPGYVWCAWHLLRASRTVTRDIQAVHADDAGPPVEDAHTNAHKIPA